MPEYLAQIKQRHRSMSCENLEEVINTDSITLDLRPVGSCGTVACKMASDSSIRATVINTPPIDSEKQVLSLSPPSENNQKDLTQVLLQKLDEIKNSPKLTTEETYKALNAKLNKECMTTNDVQDEEHKCMVKEWRQAMTDWTITFEDSKAATQADKNKVNMTMTLKKCDDAYKDYCSSGTKCMWEYFVLNHVNLRKASTWLESDFETEYKPWLQDLNLAGELKMQMLMIVATSRATFEKLADMDRSNANDKGKMTDSNMWVSACSPSLSLYGRFLLYKNFQRMFPFQLLLLLTSYTL